MNPRKKGGCAPNPQVKQLIDFAFQTYRAKYGVKLIVSAADGAQVKRVLKTLDDLELLKRYWSFFLNYRGDDFTIKNATKDIKTFCCHINRLVQLTRRKSKDIARYSPGDERPPLTEEEKAEVFESMIGPDWKEE